MYTNSYSPQRQLLFVQRQFSLSRQSWYIAAAAVFGLLLVVSVFTAVFNPYALPEIQGLYLAAFTFGGLLFTSMIFKELHAPHRSYFFLTLPASSLEKLVGAWLLTSPLYILGFTLVSFILYFLSFLIAGIPFSLSYFFNDGLGAAIISYAVIQTIFLWGAVYFRKNNFLKTVLAMIVLGILVGLYTGSLFALFFDSFSHTTTSTIVEESSVPAGSGESGAYIRKEGKEIYITQEDVPGMNAFVNQVLEPTLNFLFWFVLGPYMLLMSYFTLKEREI